MKMKMKMKKTNIIHHKYNLNKYGKYKIDLRNYKIQ